MIPSHIERAKQMMGREPVNPIGECFDSVGVQAVKWMYAGRTFTVCHGIGVASMPGEEGNKIKHAWIEIHGFAYDTTWGLSQKIDKYRADMKLKYVVEYSIEEFFSLWVKHDFPGPWDQKIENAGRSSRA